MYHFKPAAEVYGFIEGMIDHYKKAISENASRHEFLTKVQNEAVLRELEAISEFMTQA